VCLRKIGLVPTAGAALWWPPQVRQAQALYDWLTRRVQEARAREALRAQAEERQAVQEARRRQQQRQQQQQQVRPQGAWVPAWLRGPQSCTVCTQLRHSHKVTSLHPSKP
jgi:hypothetical protein